MKMMDIINSGQVYIIAEMSANHAGRLENALKIVHAAKEAGAHCLKIQTYTADTITLDCDNEYFQIHGGLWDGYKLYDLYKEACMPWEWQPLIKEECDKIGMDFLSTPFDNTAVDFLEDMNVGAYKIASFELVDIPLIEYTASKQKPMIISCGMGSVDEIQDAVDACRLMGNEQIFLLKCCSEYPANYADMRLANISDMKNRFGVKVGLSDHSLGSIGAVVGVSLGACVVEKHFCLDRKIKNPDSEFSMEPQEFSQMVKDIENAVQIKGKVSYELSEKEKSSLVFRRSLFVAKDIAEGEEFTTENIRSVRPENGMKPKYMESIIGKKAKYAGMLGLPLDSDMVTNGNDEEFSDRGEYHMHKYALVTGSTKGIGKGIGLSLLRKGYFVFFNYSKDDESAELLKNELQGYSGRYEIIKADLSDYDSINIVHEEIKKRTGTIDVIILNTGITVYKPYQDINTDEWNRVMDTNINIPNFIIQKLDHMIEDGGRIIFISSVLGIVPHATSIVYGISKAALIMLSKSLVKVYKSRKITVNAIAPGFIETEWQKDKPLTHRDSICNKIALERFGTIDEVADLCMCVVDNAYINGAVLQIDGGYGME